MFCNVLLNSKSQKEEEDNCHDVLDVPNSFSHLMVYIHITPCLSVSFVPGYDARSKTEFICSAG